MALFPLSHSAQTFQIYFWIELIRNYVVFTSIQSAEHVFEIKEVGMASIPPTLTPNEICAVIGVPTSIPATIMVGL